jgi:hypothetical protein
VKTFEECTTPLRRAPGRFVHEVPDGWQQGRGAFGGLVLATLVRAVEAEFGDAERTLRTLTAELCGPVLPGPVEIALEALRIGSGTATVAARLVQNGEVQTHAVLVLGRARAAEPRYDGLVPPERPPWRDITPIPEHEMGAPFSRLFEYRNTGPVWFTGGSEARTAGWARPKNAGAARDAAYVVGMADVWWPALFSILHAPRPAATLTFSLDLVGDCAGLAPDAPLFHEAHTQIVRAGWAPEVRTLWGEDGRLLSINHQTFVIIK